MGRRIMRRSPSTGSFPDGLFPLLLLSAGFAAGAVVGFLLALLSGKSAELSAYLQKYFLAVGGEGKLSVSLLSVMWDMIRWPLLVILLGMTRIAVIAMPMVLFLRAFLLSYAIAIFARLFGGSGLLVALMTFGIVVLLVIPVLFVVAYDGLKAAALRGQGKNDVFVLSRERLTTLLVCTGSLILATAIQWSLMPSLLSAVCAKLFIL